MRNIIIRHEFPPIPTRIFDYRAIREGWEPGDPAGYGEKPHEALQDLLSEEEILADEEDTALEADAEYALSCMEGVEQ